MDLIETEIPLIASLLRWPDETINECAGVVVAQQFADPLHRKLWQVVESRIEANQPVTPRSLRRVDGLAQHADRIRDIHSEAITLAHLQSHVAEFLDTLLRRKLEQIAKLIEEKSDTSTAQDITDEILSKLMDSSAGIEDQRWKTLCEIMGETITEIERAMANQGKLLGFETGFRSLDYLTNGLQGGRVYVVAGRPGKGKSVLGVQLAVHVARTHKAPVGIFSLEMPDSEIGQRMIASESGVSAHRLSGKEGLSEHDISKIMRITGEMKTVPIFVRDFAFLNRLGLRLEVRKLLRSFKTRVVVLDYIQLMQTQGGVKERRFEIGEVTKTCKQLAKQHDLVFILISQLNREADGKTATLSNLADSDEIGRDADVVITINDAQTTLTVIKNRGGATGEVPVTFVGEHFKFEEF